MTNEVENMEKEGFLASVKLWVSAIIDKMKEQNLIKLLPFLLLLFTFSIIFIYKNHHVAKTMKEIGELKKEIKELRAEESSIKFDLMNQSRQSKVIDKLEGTGVEELRTPPYKIKREKDE